MPRRVLHVVDRTTGGVPAAVRSYIRNSPADVVHTVLSPFRVGAPAAVWDDAGADHLDLGEGHLSRMRRVAAAVASTRPHVLHAHSSFSGAYARLAVRRRAVRMVYSPHCFSFERRDLAAPARAVYRAVESALGWNTDDLAACGRGEQLLASRLRSLHGKTVVIPNVPSIPPAEAPAWTGGVLRVGMAGRLSSQKDPAYFDRAVADLATVHPATSGVWIGSRDRAFPHAFSAPIGVTGWLAPPDLRRALAHLHLYIHSAAWEGFPIAILDAHAAGLPILARPISALRALPWEVTVSGGLHRLRALLPHPAPSATWAAENRRIWRAYLAENTPELQRAALAEVWGADAATAARSTGRAR